MQDRVIEIGIAGLGRLGILHAENIAYKIRNVELTALCDTNNDKLLKCKEQLKHLSPVCRKTNSQEDDHNLLMAKFL